MSLRRTTPLIALMAVLSLTACETLKGAGRDVQTAGQAVTATASEAQSDMQ
jgi:predicted small secreted protein